MENQDLLIRFPNKEMTVKEFIIFCKHILYSFQQFAPNIATVGIWSDDKNSNYYFDDKLSDFESIILKEMQISGKEYAFINEDKMDKKLNLNSKSFINFSFSFSLNNASKHKILSIVIWAGKTEEVGILNLEFVNTHQQNILFTQMLSLVNFCNEIINPLYATSISNEFRRKVKRPHEKYWIGWINYFSNKEVAGLLPNDIGKKVLPNGGVIFWLSEEKPLSTDEKIIEKAIQIRNILGEKGLLIF